MHDDAYTTSLRVLRFGMPERQGPPILADPDASAASTASAAAATATASA